ncbi:hypothetical protein [Paenibacillus sp. GCM10027626]|uniref:hypothetical protein n=1 Tax=Paenibacillus sp. GCM10027626 TaxID=3273411 RepID=UPI00362866F2
MNQRSCREQLDNELMELTFTARDQVIGRTHPRSRREKLAAWWNKELELSLVPLVPIVAAASLLLFWAMAFYSDGPESEVLRKQRTVIEAGGNMYWDDIFAKKVRTYEK